MISLKHKFLNTIFLSMVQIEKKIQIKYFVLMVHVLKKYLIFVLKLVHDDTYFLKPAHSGE
jgi:hypothetical protein